MLSTICGGGFMRNSARAVIIKNGELLTIFRRKIKGDEIKEYYVIPGGGIEGNETPQETVVRELKEELNVDIKVLNYLGENERENGKDIYYKCEIISGTPHLGGEELERMTESNYYEPKYIKLCNLNEIDISAKEIIRKALKMR